MPTAAKLIGAILFAVLTWWVSERVRDALPGGATMTLMPVLNALIGAAMGWRVMGARAGDGFVPAIGYALTTVFAITFWAVLIWSGWMMFVRSTRGLYDDPVEAMAGLGNLMVDNAASLVVPGVVGLAVIGGMVCGLIVEFLSHRWS